MPPITTGEDFAHYDIDTLKAKVEAKRKELKEAYEEEKVLDRAMWFVKDGKTRLGFKDRQLAEFVAERTLEDVPKRDVQEERIRIILRSISIPEERVEAVRGYGRKYYQLRESPDKNAT